MNKQLQGRRLRWTVHVARIEQSIMHRVLVGKPEGNGSLGRSRHRWEDNIKMYLREVGCVPGDWIALAEDQDPLAGLCKVCNELPGSLKAD